MPVVILADVRAESNNDAVSGPRWVVIRVLDVGEVAPAWAAQPQAHYEPSREPDREITRLLPLWLGRPAPLLERHSQRKQVLRSLWVCPVMLHVPSAARR
jgi:hypothetical protein